MKGATMKGVAIVSGGMDSVTLAHWLTKEYDMLEGDLHLLAFNYGQRHKKELVFARQCSFDVGARFDIIDLHELSSLLAQSGSSLVDTATPVPDGHYAEESMKITVVPNRNAIMLSIASGVAVAEKAAWVATGVHAGDHFIYPDCRPMFIDTLSLATNIGNEGFVDESFHIKAPFIQKTKADIASVGDSLDVDWTATWSCYKGHIIHCGTCGTCTERREAFSLAGVVDPTEYENG
jgi:7-cyano-7-deazaguanine synthase